MKILRIALAQINTTVGDLEGNYKKIVDYIDKAKALNCDIVVFPELSLCGYPPEDLLLKPHFIKANHEYLSKIIKDCGSIMAVVGLPYQDRNELFNAAAVIYNKKVRAIYKKVKLPNYSVFDEVRYFKNGTLCPVLDLDNGIKIGISICEDIWHDDGPHNTQTVFGGANILLNLSSSPYHVQKIKARQDIMGSIASRYNVFMFYCNSVGGQDELVFDGASMAFDNKGGLVCRAKQFREDLLITDIDCNSLKIKPKVPRRKFLFILPKESVKSIKVPFKFCVKNSSVINKKEKLLEPVEEIYSALMLGLRDYVAKNGFKKVLIGLSGGIDSALVALLAVDALGKDNVIGVSMPSMYSSEATQEDAKKVASNLGIGFFCISINALYENYLATLKGVFKNIASDSTEENIQARIRGNLLMALSNKFGWLVVTTGNKSELSVGYCTLYGDMAGGFALIKDVPKTVVYKLARYRNSKSTKGLTPEDIFLRPPSAELKPNQTDQDTLPAYDDLDKIIDAYIEKDKSKAQIIRMGFDKELINNTIAMIDKNEYKRRQSPIGIKITPKAFGKDRRVPITNKFYE